MFSCYLARRNLHSFPTRRSSDLQEELAEVARHAHPVDGVVRLRYQHVGHRPRLQELFEHANGLGLPHPGEQTVEGANGRADRKSTRLNSSHVAISYAVFCLKKKK